MYLSLKAVATVSIFMIIYVYLSGLPKFISMDLFYMYFHTYAFYQAWCHVLYTIKLNIIILTAQ